MEPRPDAGAVYCLDCQRAVPTSKELLVTIPSYCPHCKSRLRCGFVRPEGAYEPSADDKETFRCAGMAWTD